MKIRFQFKRKSPVLVSILFLGLILFAYFNLSLNITTSMPVGIYIRSVGKIKVGDIVLSCLNDPYKTLGLKKSYLERGHACNGADPVIKMVIALPGDHVVLANNYIEVNRIKYFFPTFYWNSKGRKLNIYPRGNYPSTRGYWLIGTHDMKSWDSRYWGPVNDKQILRKIKPLIIW